MKLYSFFQNLGCCVFFISCIYLSGCKKSENSNIDKPVTNAPFIYGIFNTSIMTDSYHGSLEFSGVFIHDDSIHKNDIPAGKVVINGKIRYYPYTTDTANYNYKFDTGVHWVISPAANVPAIEYISQGGYPVHTEIIPDTMNSSDGWQFNLTKANTNNSDSFIIFIDDRIEGNIDDYVSVKRAVGDPAIIVPSLFDSMVRVFPTVKYPRTLNITIRAAKYDYKVFSGKTYLFRRQYDASKAVYVR